MTHQCFKKGVASTPSAVMSSERVPEVPATLIGDADATRIHANTGQIENSARSIEAAQGTCAISGSPAKAQAGQQHDRETSSHLHYPHRRTLLFDLPKARRQGEGARTYGDSAPVILRPPSAPHRRSIHPPLGSGDNNRPVYGLASCPSGRMFRLPRRPAALVSKTT